MVIGLILPFIPLYAIKTSWVYVVSTDYLTKKLHSEESLTASYVVDELGRRLKNGQIESAQHPEIINALLAGYVKDSPLEQAHLFSNLLDEYCLSGLMSEKQKTAFFENMTTVEFRVRPTVVLGDPVPCQAICYSRDHGVKFWMQITVDHYQIDGKPINYHDSLSPPGHTNGGLDYPNIVQMIPYDLPGSHILTMNAKIMIYGWPRGDTSVKHYEESISCNQHFVLFEHEPADYIKLVRNDYLESKTQGCIRPSFFLWNSQGQKGLYCSFVSYELPVNCAFDVYAQLGDAEICIGSLTIRKDSGKGCHSFHWPDAPELNHINIILRSNERRARETTDLFEIWDGELFFKDVYLGIEGK